MRTGWSELIVILVLAFLLFGTQRVSGLGKALQFVYVGLAEAFKPSPHPGNNLS